MQRILFRAPQSPFDNFTALKTFSEDKIWSNVGNLLFVQGVYKSLYNEKSVITIMDKPANAYDPKFIDESYDILILPFANAFRRDFIPKLNEYTKLINNLHIPVVVVGIGSQQQIDKINEFSSDFDKEVIDFVNAVLKHSKSIGVRGEYTKRYLNRLGFAKNVRVIGCPSMFMYGNQLPQMSEKVSHSQFKLNLNGKGADSAKICKYLFNTGERATFIPQVTRELKMLYTGCQVKGEAENYPYKLDSPVLDNVDIRFPLSVQGWIELLQQGNMSIGTRIHGSIASVLAGLPTFLICTDSRTLELAEYHQIPHCKESDFDFDKPVYEIYKEYDFSTIYNGHSDRYNVFKDFMSENGIIIENPPFTAFEEKIKSIQWKKALTSITRVNNVEMLRRLNLYYSKIGAK